MKKMIGMFLMAGCTLFGADPTHHDTYKWDRTRYMVLNHNLTEDDAPIQTLALHFLRDTIVQPQTAGLMEEGGTDLRPVPYSDAMLYARHLYECAIDLRDKNPACAFPVVAVSKKVVVFSLADYETAYILFREWWKVILFDDDTRHHVWAMRVDWLIHQKEPDMSHVEDWLCMDCRVRRQ